MREAYVKIADFLTRFWDIPQLLFRLMMAYRFYKPALFKIEETEFVISWFREVGYPFPVFCAYAVGISQLACVVLLPLGLLTRVVAGVQCVVMAVAIITIHWVNGFSNANDGIEIPLYYFLMLFSLLIIGPGRFSLDALIARGVRKPAKPAGKVSGHGVFPP